MASWEELAARPIIQKAEGARLVVFVELSQRVCVKAQIEHQDGDNRVVIDERFWNTELRSVVKLIKYATYYNAKTTTMEFDFPFKKLRAKIDFDDEKAMIRFKEQMILENRIIE